MQTAYRRSLLGQAVSGWLILVLLIGQIPGGAAPSPSSEPVIHIDQRDLPGYNPSPAVPATPTPSGAVPILLPSHPPEKVKLSPEASEVVKLVNAYRARLHYPALRVAADLTRVAQEHCHDMLLHGYLDIESPYRGSHQYRLWQAGISDPSPLSFAFVFEGRRTAPAVMVRDPKIFSNFQERDLSHIGIGLASGVNRRLGNGRLKCLTLEVASRGVLLLSPRRQQYAPGSTVEVVGLMGPGLQAPQVIVMPPNCSTLHPAVEVDDRGAFRSLVLLQAGKGEYIIEVMPNGPLGPVMTNLLPVYAGVAPPLPLQTYQEVKARSAQADRPISLDTARKNIFELLNRERAICGLQPLQYSEILEKLAQGHSLDMRQNRFFAHVSPRRGTIRQRSQVLNLRFLKIGENLAINNSVEEAHRTLMLSPAHRNMILDSDVDYVGIGVVQGDDPVYGKHTLWITQNFARFLQETPPP